MGLRRWLWLVAHQSPLLERALLVMLGALLLPGLVIAFGDLVPIPTQLDFSAYYLAAQALGHGQSPYDMAVQRDLAAANGNLPVVPYLYPPAFAACVRPLATLPFPLANQIWLALNLLWLLLAAICMAQLLPRAYRT
ncbi:MAG: hypothetical protein HGB28_05545, partial [Oscillochloris sp.]|nr:hypothetical protein [Oscillochloris sp.]